MPCPNSQGEISPGHSVILLLTLAISPHFSWKILQDLATCPQIPLHDPPASPLSRNSLASYEKREPVELTLSPSCLLCRLCLPLTGEKLRIREGMCLPTPLSSSWLCRRTSYFFMLSRNASFYPFSIIIVISRSSGRQSLLFIKTSIS